MIDGLQQTRSLQKDGSLDIALSWAFKVSYAPPDGSRSTWIVITWDSDEESGGAVVFGDATSYTIEGVAPGEYRISVDPYDVGAGALHIKSS